MICANSLDYKIKLLMLAYDEQRYPSWPFSICKSIRFEIISVANESLVEL